MFRVCAARVRCVCLCGVGARALWLWCTTGQMMQERVVCVRAYRFCGDERRGGRADGLEAKTQHKIASPATAIACPPRR